MLGTTGKEMSNCRRCHKLFVKPPAGAPVSFRARRMCINCMIEEEGEIRDMQNAMRDVESITTEDLAAQTGLDVALVERHLRNNHFELPPEGVLGKCTRCGKPAVATHRFCNGCRFRLLANVTGMRKSLMAKPGSEKIYRPQVLLPGESVPSGVMNAFSQRRARMFSSHRSMAVKGKYSGR